MFTVYMRIFPDNRVYIGCTSKSLVARQGINGRGYASSPFFSEYSVEDWAQVVTEVIATTPSIEVARDLESKAIRVFLDQHPREQLLNTQLGSHYSWDDNTKQKLANRLRQSEIFQESAKSFDHRAKISQSLTQKWKDPAYRDKVTKSIKTSAKARLGYADPEKRKKVSAALKAYHADPEKHARFLECQRSPQRRANLSKAIRNSEAHKQSTVDPKRNAKLSASLKAYYADPEHLKTMRDRLLESENFHEAMRSPERKAKISKAFKGRRAIHKGEERRFIKPEDLDLYLDQGWEPGWGSHKKTTSN